MSISVRQWLQEHRRKSQFSGRLFYDEALKQHTYYQIGGVARVIAIPYTLYDLAFLTAAISQSQCRFFILAAGSNVLASDSGFDGLVIKVNKLTSEIGLEPNGWLKTGSSVKLPTLLSKAARSGWGGLEFLAGIPGLVGGAVAMNADARFGDVQQSVQDRLKKVEVAVLKENDTNQVETKEYSTDKLRFEYRKNLFLQPNEIILNCYWEIAQTDPKEIKTKIRSLLKKRKETQPINFPSCGSVFKNVTEKDGTKISAWQVIDKLGLKGAKIGNAQFSEIHGNFIVNLGSAKAADVKALIELAKQRAKNELQIILEEEVVYLE